MIDDDVLAVFRNWFQKQVEGDVDFEGLSADAAIAWAERQGRIRVPEGYGGYEQVLCIDALLSLPSSGVSLREFVSRIGHGRPHPFPTKRRVGGDHDRGFSERANDMFAKRAAELSESTPKQPPYPIRSRTMPLRPPLKKKED